MVDIVMSESFMFLLEASGHCPFFSDGFLGDLGGKAQK
jgi:hypothetical protein